MAARKNQKMPYKMYVGIQAKRKRVAEWKEAEVKASGVVTANKKRLRELTKEPTVVRKRRADEPLSGTKVFGGVMHVGHLLGGAAGGGRGRGGGGGRGRGGRGRGGRGGGKGRR